MTLSGPDSCFGANSHDAASDALHQTVVENNPSSSPSKPIHADGNWAKQSVSDCDSGTSGMSFVPPPNSSANRSNVPSPRSPSVRSSGPPDLKKSFNNVFGKISDRMKIVRQDTGRLLGEYDPDGWDTMSMRSDAFSDDDDDASSLFNLDTQQELPAFEHSNVAAAAGDDDVSVEANDMHKEESDICSELKSPCLRLVRRVLFLCESCFPIRNT